MHRSPPGSWQWLGSVSACGCWLHSWVCTSYTAWMTEGKGKGLCAHPPARFSPFGCVATTKAELFLPYWQFCPIGGFAPKEFCAGGQPCTHQGRRIAVETSVLTKLFIFVQNDNNKKQSSPNGFGFPVIRT